MTLRKIRPAEGSARAPEKERENVGEGGWFKGKVRWNEKERLYRIDTNCPQEWFMENEQVTDQVDSSKSLRQSWPEGMEAKES